MTSIEPMTLSVYVPENQKSIDKIIEDMGKKMVVNSHESQGFDGPWAELTPVTEDVKEFLSNVNKNRYSYSKFYFNGTDAAYGEKEEIIKKIMQITHFYKLYDKTCILYAYIRNADHGRATFLITKDYIVSLAYMPFDHNIFHNKGEIELRIDSLPESLPKYVIDTIDIFYEIRSLHTTSIAYIVKALIAVVKDNLIEFQTRIAPIILQYEEKTKVLKEHESYLNNLHNTLTKKISDEQKIMVSEHALKEKNLEAMYQNKHIELQKKYDVLEKQLINELEMKYKCFEKSQIEANEIILTSAKELSIKQSKFIDEQKLLLSDQNQLECYKKAFDTVIMPYVEFQCQVEQYNENVQKLKNNKQKLQAIALKSKYDQEEIENQRKQLNLDINVFNEEKRLFLLHSNLGLDEIEF